MGVLAQAVPIKTFVSLLGAKLSDMNDTLTKNYRARIETIDEANGFFSWHKGFNGDYSEHNQEIYYKKTDSTLTFSYAFIAAMYYDDYQKDLSSSPYTRGEDSIEDWGYKVIVKNYQLGKYLIKLGQLASTDGAMIKVIQRLR